MGLQIEVDVLNRTLPAPKDWAFHLDLWQNRIPWPVTTKFLFGVKSISTLAPDHEDVGERRTARYHHQYHA